MHEGPHFGEEYILLRETDYFSLKEENTVALEEISRLQNQLACMSEEVYRLREQCLCRYCGDRIWN